MYSKRNWDPFIIAATLALLVALASGANVLAEDISCSGSLGAIQVDNLSVPQSATCTLNGTRVTGSIFVETNATLLAYNVQVNGNIQADTAARVNVYAGSFVGGSVQIIHSGAADILGASIDSNLYFDENDLFLNAANNTIGGNLQAFNNTGGLAINGNTIDGNLQCKANFPSPTGGGNVVAGNMEDQCANFGGDPIPAPTTPPPTATNTPPAPTATSPAPTATPSVIPADLEAPTVQWIAPVIAGERFDVRQGEQILLEAVASDNVGIGTVRFLRWDAVTEQYVTLGTLVQPPFRLEISATSLNPEWNQVFVIASDQARNSSDYPYIWLYKLAEGGGQAGFQIFLPIAGK